MERVRIEENRKKRSRRVQRDKRVEERTEERKIKKKIASFERRVPFARAYRSPALSTLGRAALSTYRPAPFPLGKRAVALEGSTTPAVGRGGGPGG